MKIICALCDRVLESREGKGKQLGICDECIDKIESGQICVDSGSTSGRCPSCNIRFIWDSPVRLNKALCPLCHTPLRRTTHLFKQGATIEIKRPHTKTGHNPPIKILVGERP